MGRFPLAFALVVAMTGAVAAADVGGTYDVRGTNFDGSAYSGTAIITITSANTCRIEWKTGISQSSGICMRSGDAFSAAYVLGDLIGLVIYRIGNDGTLDGQWTVADTDGVGTEVLTPH